MISVALCTFNGKKYIKDQLLSIIHQNKKVDEIVICDDGSNDSTLEIIKSFQKEALIPIKLFVNHPPKGTANNFFSAINLCQGDIVFLSDQDDIWLPNKVEIICNYLIEHPSVNVVFTNAQLINGDGEPIPTKETLWDYFFPQNSRKRCDLGMMAEEFCRGNHITGATMAFRKNFVKQIDPVDGYLHDELIANTAVAQHTIGYINECLIKYRIHSGQQIGIGKENNLSPQDTKEDYRTPDLPDDRLLKLFIDKTDIQRIEFYRFRYIAIHNHNPLGLIRILLHANKYRNFYKKKAWDFFSFDILANIHYCFGKII